MRAARAGFGEQPIGKNPAAARVLQKAPDHGAEPDHDGDEAERVTDAGLHGCENFQRRKSGGKAQPYAYKKKREECMETDEQD